MQGCDTRSDARRAARHVAHRVAAIAAAVLLAAMPAAAQRAPSPAIRPTAAAAPSSRETVQAPPPDDGDPLIRKLFANPTPRWAPVASLVVPGSGQLAMRQTRGAAYIAAELYAWLVYREYSRDARDRRAEYHRTAREVARRAFGATRDTSAWAYYEAVLDFVASGQYSLTPGGALTPETDESTYNGHAWLTARSLYWLDPNRAPPTTDPAYLRAIAEYKARAVQGEFMWSWRNQQLQRQSYMDAIARENQVTRYRNTAINVILVNHLLSAIDALTSVRLRESRGPAGESRFEATVPWAPFGRGSRRAP